MKADTKLDKVLKTIYKIEVDLRDAGGNAYHLEDSVDAKRAMMDIQRAMILLRRHTYTIEDAEAKMSAV